MTTRFFNHSRVRRTALSAALLLCLPALAPKVMADTDTTNAYEARALVTTSEWAVLSSQILAPIASMPKRPGATFHKGDTLVTFDCAPYKAQQAAQAAAVRKAEAQLAAQERLFELKSAGELDVAMARADRDRAQANLELQNINLDRCAIKAPFAGAVVGWDARPHQTAEPGAKLIEIVGTSGLELELIVPSAWLAWLKKGQMVTAHIDETGGAIKGQVSRLSGRIDPVSQTIKIYATIAPGQGKLLAGMSGRAIIDHPAN
ncbi:efflux RND transporter periplasmic adaptor subunit [Kordiimonas marina]|uniref:efflux RND transporter periplasmic adaptor subunit n=1 Tax=Kordiimonas marina TaxID=2872312 RepID=UPI001FF49371|nr:efflux RND transporter periplasmic adaptor subunit [Kordiimonas marina]MCJ9429441.1 efflux RND transporter periplasmic adaptor subunit [Kordiimonas marina]